MQRWEGFRQGCRSPGAKGRWEGEDRTEPGTIQKQGQQKHVWMLQPSLRWTWESGSSLRACDIPWPPTPRPLTSLEEDHCGCRAKWALVKFCTRPWSNLQKTDCVQLGPDTTKRFPCKKTFLLLHPPSTPGPVAFHVHTEKQAPQSLAKFPISTTKKSHLCLIQTQEALDWLVVSPGDHFSQPSLSGSSGS